MTKHHPLGAGAPSRIRTGGSTGLVGSFGMVRDSGRRMHKGTDYLCNVMDRVYAAHDGVLARVGFEWRGGKECNDGYGSRVVLQGRDGVETRYAHLTLQVFKKGMSVKCGDLIGFAGRTGNVGAGPTHLHFEVRIDGEPVNPEWWLTGAGSRDGIAAHELET